MISRWYVTVAAVQDFLRICGAAPVRDGPLFDGAAKELDAACESARLVRAAGESSRDAAIYRANVPIRGTGHLIDLYVAEALRPEGDLPQLVRVRLKRGPHRAGRRK